MYEPATKSRVGWLLLAGFARMAAGVASVWYAHGVPTWDTGGRWLTSFLGSQ